jgi:hypothetical protein
MRCAVIAALAATLGSSPALAACPTGDLLDGAGIRLEREQPFFSSTFFRRHGKIEERRRQVRDGKELTVTATYLNGLLPLYNFRQGDGGTVAVTTSYNLDGFSLNDLPQRGTVTLREKLTVNQKLEDANGSLELRYLGASRIRIGECRYNVWRVRATSRLGTHHAAFEHHYAPDLDLVIQTTRLDPKTGKPVSQITFDRIERGGIRKN